MLYVKIRWIRIGKIDGHGVETMTWQEIRNQYQHSWLLVEALNAYTEGAQRIIPHLNVIKNFDDDWRAAWEEYKHLHHLDKYREYYVLHTDRVELDIGVLDAFGRAVT